MPDRIESTGKFGCTVEICLNRTKPADISGRTDSGGNRIMGQTGENTK